MARRPAVHEMITSRKVPKPTGPYPHGVRVSEPGRMLFVSGQLPAQTPNGAMFTGEIRKQAEIAIGNVRNIILDAGFTMDEVVQVRIYVTDLKHFERVDDVYQKQFGSQALPARSLVQVAKLPQEAGILVEAQAVKRGEPAMAAGPLPSDQEMYDPEGGMG
jgi:2-iminobutanoate/2-iminopropanoate deaminase